MSSREDAIEWHREYKGQTDASVLSVFGYDVEELTELFDKIKQEQREADVERFIDRLSSIGFKLDDWGKAVMHKEITGEEQ